MSDPILQALEAARGLVRQGKVHEATQLYGVILKHLPDNQAAKTELAALQGAARRSTAGPDRLQRVVSLHGEGCFAEALHEAQLLAADDPRSAIAANMIGVLSLNLGNREQAVDAFRRALALDPNMAEVEANLGTLLTEMGRPREALPHLQRAAAARPEAGGILSSLANVHSALGARDLAVEFYRRAIAADPTYPHAYSNLGAVLTSMGRFAEAEAAFGEALRLKPDFADGWLNYGHLLSALKRNREAENAFQAALSIHPALIAARTALGLLLADTGRAEAAADQYRLAADGDPSNLDLLARSLYMDAMICRWGGARDAGLARLASTDFTAAPDTAPSPFLLLTLLDDPQAQKRAASAFVAREAANVPGTDSIDARPGGDRIRLGYFSADFHGHATMYLMARLFELHDRDAFEVHAFSFSPQEDDAMRDRVIRNVDHFHEIGALSPEAAAAKARALGIDIAVDLKGFTRDSRAAIFLHRAAPVQVNYLGYPGTCGSDIWDYIIADRVIVPDGSEDDYAEKILFMPDSYQVNDDRRVIADRRFSRAECGLPEKGFVFCCFNNSYKITPVEFDIWMRLLRAVEGSVLWLLGTSEAAERNLRAEAARRGVEPARIVFAPRMPVPEHLARHALADLFLDTFIVNAHTTASDALWAGLPVLARPGKSFVSRVSASLLVAAGLPELVAASADDYEAEALQLARDPARLATLRSQLQHDPARLQLFDTQRYVRHLEEAYRRMVSNQRAGRAPEHIQI